MQSPAVARVSQKLIEDSSGWLHDTIINAVQSLLKEQSGLGACTGMNRHWQSVAKITQLCNPITIKTVCTGTQHRTYMDGHVKVLHSSSLSPMSAAMSWQNSAIIMKNQERSHFLRLSRRLMDSIVVSLPQLLPQVVFWGKTPAN